MDDVIYGLSTEEAQQAVTEAFYSSIEQYLDGDLTAEEAKAKIAKLLADYVNSSSAFTDDQKTEINDIISQYLSDIDLENILTNQGEAIDQINNTFEKYVKQNEQTINLLQQTLEEEINNNMNYTQEQLDILNDLHTELSQLEALHYTTITEKMYETISKFDHLNDENKHNMYSGLAEWKAYTAADEETGTEESGTYKVNDFVLYRIGQDYEHTNGVIENDRDVRIYRNLTGVNTDVPPSKDTTNWEEMSLATAIENIYNMALEGVDDFYTWLENHSTDENGNVQNQYVTYGDNIYINTTGEFTGETPDKDEANWQKVSILEAIQKNLETAIKALQGDVLSYTKWCEDQLAGLIENGPDGSVIEQYVTYKDEVYVNVTGEFDSNVTPDKDTTNWQKVTVYQMLDTYNKTFLERLYEGIGAWSADEAYIPGDYVLYEHRLYRNLNGHNTATTPDLDTDNWEESSIMTVVNNTYNTFMSVMNAAAYVPDQNYKAGDYVVYDNIMYKNVSDNSAKGGSPLPGNGENNSWIPVSLTEMIDSNYQTFITTVGAKDYNPADSYQAGDYVVYGGVLYRASDATTGTFDSSKWEKVSITQSVEKLSSELEELQLQVSLNDKQLDSNLRALITENKSLSDEQREAMLALIDNQTDVTAEGLKNLEADLLTIINDNSLGDAEDLPQGS